MQNVNPLSWTTPSSRRFPGVGYHPSSPWVPPNLRVWGPSAAAGLLFVALMVSFLSVVQQGVARAEQQQLQAADRGRAELLCHSEPLAGQRQSCLAGLKATASLASLTP